MTCQYCGSDVCSGVADTCEYMNNIMQSLANGYIMLSIIGSDVAGNQFRDEAKKRGLVGCIIHNDADHYWYKMHN